MFRLVRQFACYSLLAIYDFDTSRLFSVEGKIDFNYPYQSSKRLAALLYVMSWYSLPKPMLNEWTTFQDFGVSTASLALLLDQGYHKINFYLDFKKIPDSILSSELGSVSVALILGLDFLSSVSNVIRNNNIRFQNHIFPQYIDYPSLFGFSGYIANYYGFSPSGRNCTPESSYPVNHSSSPLSTTPTSTLHSSSFSLTVSSHSGTHSVTPSVRSKGPISNQYHCNYCYSIKKPHQSHPDQRCYFHPDSPAYRGYK